jgi:hypothetical protein
VPNPEDASRRVADMISQAVGELVTEWVLIVGSLDDDGDQVTWQLMPTGQVDRHTLGLLHYARVRIETGIANDPEG